MCDLNGPFKLCTCKSPINRRKPHWILHRTLIQKNDEYVIMGMLIIPNLFELYLAKNLKKRLNSTNVFDFDYKAQEGDCLELFSEEISEADFDPEDLEASHRFEFRKGKWQAIEPFDATIYEHQNELSGSIMGPKTELTQAYEKFLQESSPTRIIDFNHLSYFNTHPNSRISQKILMDLFLENKPNI